MIICSYQTCNIVNTDVINTWLFLSEGIPKPIISLFPKSEVTWGDNTTITCSISQVHPLVQGHFILKNSDQKERGERGTNDANFSFFEVTFEDEGQYQCRYESKQGFVFLSSSVMLHVTGK